MKSTVFLLFSLLLSTSSYSCDVCGASSGMSSLGLLNAGNNHFIGLGYNRNFYKTQHPPLEGFNQVINGTSESQKMDLFGRINVGNKWQLLAFLPYRINRLKDTISLRNSGIGDATVIANYKLWNKEKLRIFVGAGCEIPIGRSTFLENGLVIPNMQLGSGSFDWMLNTTGVFKQNKWGINQELFFKYNTNGGNYKFGNQWNTNTAVFYEIQRRNVLVYPQLGVRYDKQYKDLDNVKYRNTSFYTGTEMIQTTAGVDVSMNQWTLRAHYKLPLYYNVAEGFVTPVNSFDIQLVYGINGNKND